MTDLSLVSIIIPCYNAERWLAEAIDSCLRQTYRPLEMILINDGSVDSSAAIIQRYAAQYPDLIRFETQANRGGRLHATGVSRWQKDSTSSSSMQTT